MSEKLFHTIENDLGILLKDIIYNNENLANWKEFNRVGKWFSATNDTKIDEEQVNELIEFSGDLLSSKSKQEALSTISNKIVGELMQFVPQNFVNYTIENIKFELDKNGSSVTFDVPISYTREAHVDFELIVDGSVKASAKILFELTIKGILSDVHVVSKKNHKTIRLGKLKTNFSMKIKELVGIIKKDIQLVDKEIFTVDLSEYQIAI